VFVCVCVVCVRVYGIGSIDLIVRWVQVCVCVCLSVYLSVCLSVCLSVSFPVSVFLCVRVGSG